MESNYILDNGFSKSNIIGARDMQKNKNKNIRFIIKINPKKHRFIFS